MIAASGAAVALFAIGAARLAAERPDPMPGRRAVPVHGDQPAWGGTMTEEPADGRLPFAEAAERYGARELVAAYRKARDELAAYGPRVRRVRHPGFLSPVAAIGYWRDAADRRGELLADHLARERTARQAALDQAWWALCRDLIDRLKRGELIACGTTYQPGSLSTIRESIPRESWNRFRFGPQNAILFGPRNLSTVVHDVLIRRAYSGCSPSTRRGRPEASYWADAERVAIEWLEDNGCPNPGDGGQAELEQHVADWLSARGHNPGESTICKHVGPWIKEQRDRLQQGS